MNKEKTMKHYIIVKFNDSVSVNGLVEPIKELFNESLKIEGVDAVNIYVSNTNLQNRHDLMIEMKLTQLGLSNFDNSEIHKKWKSEYGQYIINKTIFDCD